MTILGLLIALNATIAVAKAHQPKPPASSSLNALERYNVKRLKHATQVIRFFERHPRILNARKTRRKAWRIVHQHQRIIRQATARLIVLRTPGPIQAIRMVFGPYAEQAIRVSSCETGGTFSTRATNGQYLGLFQMGDYARGRYGHSWTALGQAKAAYRYFVDSGRDWSPWECRP
jgi:hypothetical protein